jgi:predicted DNA-binding transcriptional regulator AlpA
MTNKESINDLRVIALRDVAETLGISFATLKREIASGTGPKIIRLSTRRVGIRVCDLRVWQEARVR